MDTKTFGIIGCEHPHIGIFIDEMLALGHTCAGIYEARNRELASELASRYNVGLVDAPDVLLASQAEIIGSSAINQEKIAIIERCERHGKHVMIDKPAVTNRADYERLRAVMARGKIKVGMLLTERFHPAVYTLKQQIDQGKLGRLVSIGIRKPHLLRPETRPPWFFSKAQCGGIIIDLLIHDVDLLRWLTGSEIASMEGVTVKHVLPEYPDFYDTASLQVMMENGVSAQLYADWHTPKGSWTWGDGRLFVTGTEGAAELRLSGDPSACDQTDRPLLLHVGHTEPLSLAELEQPPATITEDFLRRLAGQSSVLTDEDLWRAVLATIDADESARSISWVEG
ncbi:oxidoreductase [Paenibacillus sp. 598K]|uniref:Gfo/Idh/MocA family protein n=1 Tax=Paenibacillus sp. 598K TaxID=1117987 RepID=UPI000FF9DF09|nr:Gfo/Idh/MocA family oxidoreductase [Paenibacillus sp. 598K]GBF72499.1 oxidoreductase [Paenibacillus sp. 598K]